ncbi:MAG: SlyX family protein [Gammaproteobacteria bacterium]|nr:SlyX family protein [Gammaproteobacteria bacterium]
MENRIIDLEIRLTHQEDHIAELDKVIYQQQQAIDLLQDQLKHLQNKLTNASEANILSPSEESPPPHY